MEMERRHLCAFRLTCFPGNSLLLPCVVHHLALLCYLQHYYSPSSVLLAWLSARLSFLLLLWLSSVMQKLTPLLLVNVLWLNHCGKIPYINKLLLVGGQKCHLSILGVMDPKSLTLLSFFKGSHKSLLRYWHFPLIPLLLNLKLNNFLTESNG